ncbi:MAG: peptide chain release factor N(5)-glutamine methyltransferase [Thiobacillaceae bacterium]
MPTDRATAVTVQADPLAAGQVRGGGQAGAPIDAWLAKASVRLADSLQLPRAEARLEAQVLAAHALGVNRAWLVAHGRDSLTPAQTDAIAALIGRRMAGEPVAYILGRREFYGLEFSVTPDVLIPRPETETLVEAALARLPVAHPSRVLDLGTGSGAIALTLAHHRPRAEITAVDRCPAALAVARRNARALGLTRVRLTQADWYPEGSVKNFDMIVANPPYVAEADPHLAQGDLRFEPRLALAAGPDGLDAIRAIVAQAPRHLRPGGWLLLEHGYDQAAACRDLLAAAGFADLYTLEDLGGRPRVTGGRLAAGLEGDAP